MQGVDKDAVAAMMEAAGEGVPDDQVDDDAGEDSDDDEEWDAFVDSRMPYVGFSCTQTVRPHLLASLLRRAPGQQDVVPKGMTAGGLARRRASLAPQPILPEVDHKINQKVLTVSGELDASTTLDDMGGAFMAAVEEDV